MSPTGKANCRLIAFSITNTKHCDEIWLRIYYPSKQFGHSIYYPISSIISDTRSFTGTITEKQKSAIRSIRSHTLKNALIAQGHFPVIFFSPGYGLPTQEYENIIVNLVSHGYIAAGVNSQFINGELKFTGRVLSKVTTPKTDTQKKALFENSLSDLNYVVQMLKEGRISNNVTKSINWDEVGLLGHSLGAATVAHFANHKLIKAVVSLDLTTDLLFKKQCHSPITVPYLHLFSSAMYAQSKTGFFPYLCENDIKRQNEKVVVLSNKNLGKMYSMHMNFCDYSTLQYQPAINASLKILNKEPGQRFLGVGDGWKITDRINSQLLNFFSQNL